MVARPKPRAAQTLVPADDMTQRQSIEYGDWSTIGTKSVESKYARIK